MQVPSLDDAEICADCPYYKSLQVAREVVEADETILTPVARQQRLGEYEIVESIFAATSQKFGCGGPEESNGSAKCPLASPINEARSFVFNNPDLRVQGNQYVRPVGFLNT